MDVRHEDSHLEELEFADCRTKWDGKIVRAFRKVMGLIRAAADEQAFYAMKSLHYEKMQGKLAGFRTMRLNDQWRLFLRIEENGLVKSVVVVKIDDPH